MTTMDKRLGIWVILFASCCLEATAAGAAGTGSGLQAANRGAGDEVAPRATGGVDRAAAVAGPAGSGTAYCNAAASGRAGQGRSPGFGTGALLLLAVSVHVASLCLLGQARFSAESPRAPATAAAATGPARELHGAAAWPRAALVDYAEVSATGSGSRIASSTLNW